MTDTQESSPRGAARYSVAETPDRAKQGSSDCRARGDGGNATSDNELAAARNEVARLSGQLERLTKAIDQHNAGLAVQETTLQASFDRMRQSYTTVTSMNSFRAMMRLLERYGRLRGIRIAMPPAPERVRVRLERMPRSTTETLAEATFGSALSKPDPLNDAPAATPTARRTDPCILIQVSSLDRGGVEQVVYDQARGVEALGKRVVVVVTGSGGDVASRLAAGGTEVEILGGYSSETYSEVIEPLRIEAAITHYSYEGLALLKRRNIPIVEVVHNYYHWSQHDIPGFRASAAPVTRRVAVSSGVADFHAEVFGYDRSDITVIANPINREGLIRPERQLLEAARRSTDGVFTFINVAQFFAAKAQMMLITAFAAVHREFPQTRLKLLGSFSDEKVHAAIIQHIATLGLDGLVDMPGFVDRRALSRHLALAHVFVQPSVYEGYSLAMTEAAHFGLPMILTRIGGAIDVIRDNDCGILIPPHVAITLGRGFVNRNTAAATTQVQPWAAPSAAAVIERVSTMSSLVS
jgi:glycosyltransferase involved in cell wall biosynthesis